MNNTDKYLKIVEWSEIDGCYIGSCPELFYGGCHGSDTRQVFDELCSIVEEQIELYRQTDKTLPKPITGREIVNSCIS